MEYRIWMLEGDERIREKDWKLKKKRKRKLRFLSTIQHIPIGNTYIMFISVDMDRDFENILSILIYRPNIDSVSVDILNHTNEHLLIILNFNSIHPGQ